MRRGLAACLLTALALAVLLAVPVPARGRGARSALDLAHAPAFGALALVVHREVRSWLPRPRGLGLLTAWALVVVFGGAMELVQTASGRHPSWHDVAANALGAAAFLTWQEALSATDRARKLVLCCAGTVLVVGPCVPPLVTLADVALQARDPSRLASFESPAELARWEFSDCQAGRSRAHPAEGRWSLRLEMGPGRYPAATLAWPPPDWSGHRALTFDVYLTPGPPLDLVVKIEDQDHRHHPGDRFERVVPLGPGRRQVRIDLGDVAALPDGRRLDLARVARLEFFAVDLRRTRTLYLDEVRLR